MLNMIFNPIVTDTLSIKNYLICTLAAMILGGIVALTASFKSRVSKSYLLSLIILPAIVQTVILMVNGNLGTGVAVMGAFSLIRFRSVPGSAKEIVNIFLTMAIGLATAIGYVGLAALFTVILCSTILLFTLITIKSVHTLKRELRITIPENLNYYHAFDDLFEQYTKHVQLVSVKTTNMGSLYKLSYLIELKDQEHEQAFINDIRCRNGNLEIAIGIAPDAKDEL